MYWEERGTCTEKSKRREDLIASVCFLDRFDRVCPLWAGWCGKFRVYGMIMFRVLTWVDRKIPRVISQPQKARTRLRMRMVDRNIARVAEGLRLTGQRSNAVNKIMAQLPKESEMEPRDKYTIFSKKSKTYRKGAHRQPKWTKITNRTIPKGF